MFFIAGADRIASRSITRARDTTVFIQPISIVSTRGKNPRQTYAKTVTYAYQEPPQVIKREKPIFNPIRVKL